MLFNTIDFAIFLPIVFLLYWFVADKNLKLQNALIVVASYVFYGWWDWRFLSLILFSTLVDYLVGRGLAQEKDPGKRKLLLWTSIGVNIGFLGFFKYYDFFLENFVSAFSIMGMEIQAGSLGIILPVGISFYTFQTLSYTLDVYRRKLEPTRDFVAFAAFVSFFPQLVAGPIERATRLLPQFYTKREFDYTKAADGMRQILWGLFKKVVIADNCAEYANLIFNHSAEMNGSTLLLGAIFFSFQIYGDFSGYSDIAIGTARLFGFKLMQNFAFPYFSRDIAEFWRRWHISLSTWFRDYLYIPLGGSRGGTLMKIRNTFLIFLVSGFWHGANWTFLVWGALNAFYFLPLLLTKRNRRNMEIVAAGKLLPGIKDLLRILLTFGLTAFAWIFFRAESISHAFMYIQDMCSLSLLEMPCAFDKETGTHILSKKFMILILAFVGVEWIGREGPYAIYKLGMGWKPVFRYTLYYGILFCDFLVWRKGTGIYLLSILKSDMRKFLLKALVFAILPIGFILGVSECADGYTDAFYIRFTTPKQKNLILGTSKAAQGLQPAVFKQILKEDFSNYAFTVSHSPFGKVYLESIKRKHNKVQGGTFILSVDPWSISSWAETPNDSANFRENELCLANTKIVDLDPNYFYLYKNLNGKYKEMLIPPGKAMFLHQDGWLEVKNIAMDSFSVAKRIEKKERVYRELYLPKSEFSTLRLQYLLKTILYLKKYGNVYLIRMPVHRNMLEMEKELIPNFEEVIEDAINLSDGFLDLTPSLEKHTYTDGNHLFKSSGEEVSARIAQWILEQE